MLPFHSCYIYGTWRSKELGGFKVTIWREAEGWKPQNQKWEAPFMEESTTQVFYLNYFPISAFFNLKRVL